MLESMRKSGRQLSGLDIDDAEATLGCPFPDSYRRFLLTHNGGRPSPECFPIEGLPLNPYGGIHFFFGIDLPEDSRTLEWNAAVSRRDIPADLLPIACDPGGNLICIRIGPDSRGQVFYWDFPALHHPPTYSNVYNVASTFDEFINGLFRCEYSPR